MNGTHIWRVRSYIRFSYLIQRVNLVAQRCQKAERQCCYVHNTVLATYDTHGCTGGGQNNLAKLYLNCMSMNMKMSIRKANYYIFKESLTFLIKFYSFYANKLE